jgi:hypothetical protein
MSTTPLPKPSTIVIGLVVVPSTSVTSCRVGVNTTGLFGSVLSTFAPVTDWTPELGGTFIATKALNCDVPSPINNSKKST